jgi:hypothetical protein
MKLLKRQIATMSMEDIFLHKTRILVEFADVVIIRSGSPVGGAVPYRADRAAQRAAVAASVSSA